MTPQEIAVNRVQIATDQAWSQISNNIYVRRILGLQGDGVFPRITPELAAERASMTRGIRASLDAVDLDLLPHDLALTARIVRGSDLDASADGERYWLVDLVPGFPGPFSITPYKLGLMFSALTPVFQGYAFDSEGDGDRYLALLADVGRLLDDMHERTRGQAERGLRMPQPMLPGTRGLLHGLKAGAPAYFGVNAARASKLTNPGAFVAAVERRIADLLVPAFAKLEALIGEDYQRRAPEQVGMWQYPGGDAVYADLVKAQTTMDLSPEQVHAAGHARMERIHSEMDALRAKVGFKGSRAEFHESLKKDPRFLAKTPDEVASRLRSYIATFKTVYGKYFDIELTSGYDVERLDPRVEGSVTFGYYQEPQPRGDQRGIFRFNGSKLEERSLISAASLLYHELVPGHHLQVATQRSNQDLHPLRRLAANNAYQEGWAEYAATLAGEAGMFDDPYDRYGRLLMDAMLTSRLVVDTGMNALRWPLEKARQYLRDNTFMSETEIQTETVRYCDIPGQALAYKLGDEKILELRARMQRHQGARFDIRRFHDAVLKPGPLPLPVLEWHIDRQIELATAG
jgi:uncharacterized protein (DUF885 family)